MCIDSCIINIPSQSGTFVIIDELALIRHNNLKSIFYHNVLFCCVHSVDKSTFCRFIKMHNGMYSSF